MTCTAAPRSTRPWSRAKPRWIRGSRNPSTSWCASCRACAWTSNCGPAPRTSPHLREETLDETLYRRVPAPEQELPLLGQGPHDQRLRIDPDLPGIAGEDPLLVVRRGDQARNHQLPHLQAGARRIVLRQDLRSGHRLGVSVRKVQADEAPG